MLMSQLWRTTDGRTDGRNVKIELFWNRIRKKGRVELFQIVHPSNWCTDICKTPISTFKPQFHHEVGLVQQRYFELFSRHGLYFHPTKDRPRMRPTSTFLYICSNFGKIYCTNFIQFFLCKIWVIINSKSAANIASWVYWMRNRCLLSKTFCTLFNQLAILTYSAMLS